MIDGSPPYVKFLWLFGGSEVCLPDSATATQLCWRFHQYAQLHTASAAARMPVDCSELHQQTVDAVLRPTFVQKLCYKLLSMYLYIHTDLKFCLLYWTASKLAYLLDTASKFALFSASILKDEMLIKKQTYMKIKTWKHYSRILGIFLLNIISYSSQLIVIILSYTLSNLGKFFERQWLRVFTARCTLVQSAVLRSHVVCLSVRPSVCDVGELWSHRLEFFKNNFTVS